MKRIIELSAIFLIFSLLSPNRAWAVNKNIVAALMIDELTAKAGYTIKAGDFQLGLSPRAVIGPVGVEVKQLTPNLSNYVFADESAVDIQSLDDLFPTPDGLRRITPITEFNILNDANVGSGLTQTVYDNRRPLWLSFTLDSDLRHRQEIFFWDKIGSQWRRLPSKTDEINKTIRAAIHLPYAQLAVLEYKEILASGEASWYKYKNCDCAASPNYPKGAKVRVTNTANGQSVVVRINDYGPDRRLFPTRVIDLDLVAFNKIGFARHGLVNVRVDPL